MGRNSRRSVLRGLGIVGVIGFAGVTTARNEPNEISEGTVIDEPGDYVLAGDLVNEEYISPCIEITADDVSLDGRGHAIRQGSGVRASGNNVTVENLTVTGYRGIEYTRTRGGVIRNNTTRGENGIRVEASTRTTIEGNECGDDVDTIRLENANRNRIRENDIHGEYGPMLFDSSRNWVEDNHIQQAENGLGVTGSRNLIRENTLISSETGGIHIRGDQNRLHRNTVTETDVAFHSAIRLEGASGNRLLQNEVTNNRGIGVELRDADDNRLIQNTICENGAEQIVIDEASTGNRLLENETDCR